MCLPSSCFSVPSDIPCLLDSLSACCSFPTTQSPAGCRASDSPPAATRATPAAVPAPPRERTARGTTPAAMQAIPCPCRWSCLRASSSALWRAAPASPMLTTTLASTDQGTALAAPWRRPPRRRATLASSHWQPRERLSRRWCVSARAAPRRWAVPASSAHGISRGEMETTYAVPMRKSLVSFTSFHA